MSRSKAAQDYQYAHSVAKVHFYSTFLNKYLRMLLNMSTVDEVHVYDVFCGRGVYANNKEGSALQALQIINQILSEKGGCDKIPRVTLHLNDICKEHTCSVRDRINERNELTYCNIQITNCDATDLMRDFVNQTTRYRSYRIRNIFFIDPYGYKQVNPQLLRRLVCDCHADVLLFLPVSFMYRFTQYAFNEDANNGAKPLRLFIEQFFDETHPIRTASNLNVRQYIDHLTQAFRFGDSCYATSYHIERDKHNYFSLFYMSKSLMGFDKAIEAKWVLDEDNGCGFRQPKPMCELFEDEERFMRQQEQYQLLRTLLIGVIAKAKQTITNADLYKFVLKHEFRPIHAKLVLSDLQKQGIIDCWKMDTGEQAPRGSFYLNYRFYTKPCAIFTYNK